MVATIVAMEAPDPPPLLEEAPRPPVGVLYARGGRPMSDEDFDRLVAALARRRRRAAARLRS